MRKKQEYTTPDEGLRLLEQSEQKYGGYENIPIVDFNIDIDPSKYKTKLKSIRLTEYILEGFEELGSKYHVKPQTLIKAVLEEFLNKKLPKKRHFAQ
jgi:hypothetical protein